MFEAIYQTSLGKKVVVVEKDAECGGAWKSINICGIEHADMGCHELGSTANIREFLEEYAGCKIVCNAPLHTEIKENWGFYPSQGCYELIHHLELIMEKIGTMLLLNSKLESVFIDEARKVAEVKINGNRLTTSKIIVTSGAEIYFENLKNRQAQCINKAKYPHLYLLISDPTPSRFTYTNYTGEGASRAMNVTRYVGLEGTGKQLIALQVYGEKYLQSEEKFLAELKKFQLIDPSAEILQTGNYIYEQAIFNKEQMLIKNSALIEFIQTGHIGMISVHFTKWKQAMRPWKEIFPNLIASQ